MGIDAAAEEQFGPYLVYERLGIGGMATVHRALERGPEGFERIVALKRLLPHLAEDASFIKSFVREAKLASLLGHINIVEIYELGRVGTEYFISMEYIDGHDIRQVLRHARKVTGPPPLHVTIGIMLQLAEALDYAHGKTDDDGHPLGLIHRDVSPSNLLVTSEGHLKVIDFGIAKAQSSQLRTQTGRVKGKLAYMAPEVINNRELDARSDLWAAGVILHELLTARPLFASKNEYQTLMRVQHADIAPPSSYNPKCPAELDAIARKALARDPDERYATAGELRDALRTVRKRYLVQTGYREVASWIAWAFAAERTIADPPRERTPPPARKTEEDEAVELVWGAGEDEPAGPLVLDEVPDVSEKHVAPIRLDTGPEADDADDADDDAPTPTPRSPRGTGPTPRPTEPKIRAARLTGAPPLRPNAPRLPIRESKSPPIAAEPAPPPAPAPVDPDTDPARRLSTQDLEESLVDERDAAETIPAAPQALPSPSPDGVVRTKQGMAVARRPPPPRDQVADAALDGLRKKRESGFTIGAAIASRGTTKRPTRTWPVVLGVVLAGGAAMVATLYATRGHDAVPPAEPPAAVEAAQHAAGTVKFIVEPTDAEVRIEGLPAHAGSPWATELAAGTHQIEIDRTGYKAWLTSLELSPHEQASVRVVLEPLGNPAQNADATLGVTTTPSGLEVVLDGQLLPEHAPLRMPIKPGPHTVAVRQDGVEVWRQSVNAVSSSDYEFSPSFSADKQRERAQGQPAAPTPEPAAIEAPAPEAPPAPAAPTPAAMPTPMIVPPPPAAPAAPPRATVPIVVPPNAVTKLSGAPPDITASGDVPGVVAAKVCIDAAGKVSSVELITKLERHAADDLSAALMTWRYAPYHDAGTAVPACFSVTLRTR